MDSPHRGDFDAAAGRIPAMQQPQRSPVFGIISSVLVLLVNHRVHADGLTVDVYKRLGLVILAVHLMRPAMPDAEKGLHSGNVLVKRREFKSGVNVDNVNAGSVSYTHLDVYKRQIRIACRQHVIAVDAPVSLDDAVNQRIFDKSSQDRKSVV